MRFLSARDAQHLYRENATDHMHTVKVLVLDPSTSPEGYSFERVKQSIASRIAYLPPFRWQVVRTGTSHPQWAIVDPDLDYHVKRIAAPAPGGPRELAELASSIVSIPLDRSRPLWEMTVVEGLEHGHVAYVVKMHHAIADGGASRQVIIDMMDVPDDDPARPAPEPVDAVPSRWRLRREGLVHDVRLLRGLPALIKRTFEYGKVGKERVAAGAMKPVSPYSCPPAPRFDRRFTPNRWLAYTTMPLDDLKAVKDAFDVTLNDVVVAMASGALRGYLADRGELPEQSMTVTIPVETRTENERWLYGNWVTAYWSKLCQEIDDPAERLHRIHVNTQACKELDDLRDNNLFNDWFEFWPVWEKVFMKNIDRLAEKTKGISPANVIVSNVRGPVREMTSTGMKVVELISVGPLLGRVGLNFTAWSYLDQITFCVETCREFIPDLWDLVNRLPDALEELKKAAASAPAVAAR